MVLAMNLFFFILTMFSVLPSQSLVDRPVVGPQIQEYLVQGSNIKQD